MDILHSSACQMMKLRKNEQKREEVIDKTLKQVYGLLVKVLSEPPKTFNWNFTNEEGKWYFAANWLHLEWNV